MALVMKCTAGPWDPDTVSHFAFYGNKIGPKTAEIFNVEKLKKNTCVARDSNLGPVERSQWMVYTAHCTYIAQKRGRWQHTCFATCLVNSFCTSVQFVYTVHCSIPWLWKFMLRFFELEFLSCFSSHFISIKNKFGLTCILSQESFSAHFWQKAAVEALNKKMTTRCL